MLKERNNTARIYDREAAKRLVNKIIVGYIPAFAEMQRKIEIRYGANL